MPCTQTPLAAAGGKHCFRPWKTVFLPSESIAFHQRKEGVFLKVGGAGGRK